MLGWWRLDIVWARQIRSADRAGTTYLFDPAVRHVYEGANRTVPMADAEFLNQIRDEARAAWHRYVNFLTPFRPELYRYCRRLTGDVWDAEDLVQDTMVGASACWAISTERSTIRAAT